MKGMNRAALIAGMLMAQSVGDIGKVVEIQAQARDQMVFTPSHGKGRKQPHGRGGVRRQQRAAAKLRNQRRHKAACKCQSRHPLQRRGRGCTTSP